VSRSDLPLDDLLPGGDPADGGADPEKAYDGGWEQALEEGDGFEHHLLGESPTTPEL
jgi:hypothetical protein